MKKILITGGAGFQGSHLAEALLKNKYQVTVLNTLSNRSEKNLRHLKNKLKIVWGSVTDKEIVNKTVRGQDVVFHMASHINVDESIQNPLDTIQVNVFGTLNVLEAIRKHKKRLIQVSSCEAYGETIKNTPINELRELRPQSPYAASKAGADRLCYAYYRTYGSDITIVRPFNVFGPRQKDRQGGALIPTLIRRALERKVLKIFGNGKQARDYMYIDDLIRAYLLVLENKNLKGEVINFGTGKATSILEIAKYIAKRLNAKIKFVKARPGEVRRFIADITKAKKLGFKPMVSIWQGVDRCIAWQKKYYE